MFWFVSWRVKILRLPLEILPLADRLMGIANRFPHLGSCYIGLGQRPVLRPPLVVWVEQGSRTFLEQSVAAETIAPRGCVNTNNVWISSSSWTHSSLRRGGDVVADGILV